MNEKKKKWLGILQQSKIFSNLSQKQIESFASLMFYCEFEPSRPLVYEGEVGNELFIIVEGSVAISVKSGEENIELARLFAGDFFGEMAMLEQEPRSASCIARENTCCLALKSKDFSQIMEKEPELASIVLNNMLSITSERLVHTDSIFSQIIQWGDEAKKRAITDSFTGLLNRRYLDETFETLIHTEVRKGMRISFAMLDIDHFGTLNKEFGSKFCDDILLEIVDVFKKVFDSDDILIRYGGDEFCFIIRGAFERAKKQCSDICLNVNALVFPQHPSLKVSCSIGLVHYNLGMDTAKLLLDSDVALYEAKKSGRNCVYIAQDTI
ncbi:GGDEF domain-containing protein [Treponema phagedenis]|uniref:diguanylate cyclase n=1 Tax=Treponema phagedenis TaxID=162 RepID=A0AAE6IRT0_TREPH|nr:GGDEF domain-containing protein [Treponema phagedenis]NVP25257.1 GGDEF domain-containing protein [Treponema phagedenis]QEJ93920.1 GGDEF domain-containing protein [Treponema phagedenis]QEJ97068.1 GGDEF domain-containing protein [Treponema phagedenis]QEK02071.1 GGDEF domain-containing protein [Treponema phagedenis]QEK07186.1 GGDEF domain-containing protein [Treponema phagedenis]